MGLLEKAQMKKQQLDESELIQEESKEELTEEPKEEPQGLLAKAQQKIQTKEKPLDIGISSKGKQAINVIEEQQGFGYKKIGSRRIVFDHNINEYRYEVIEPQLNETEKELKKELAHLFKMLADIDTFDMNDEEKEKFLGETLEQIIIDNDIKLEPEPESESKNGFLKKIKPKKKPKSSKNLFSKILSKKKKEEETEEIEEEVEKPP
ncbi:MAG: hypothetical protein KAI20_06050, partial [Thermoplasmatales archaeon]|nr:hypothetical protein [Thermoplasmatales archaeon]